MNNFSEHLICRRAFNAQNSIESHPPKLHIAINPDPSKERPLGLDGNNFAKATIEAIILATKPLNPPTFTNIMAMEAPSGGYNFYEYEIIEFILKLKLKLFIHALTLLKYPLLFSPI
jgi:hypothetical protein